jgi:hypothetical protein
MVFPKKCRLRPQNGYGSLGPQKTTKIVNYATIKETEKLKETMLGSKWNRRVATNIHLDQSQEGLLRDYMTVTIMYKNLLLQLRQIFLISYFLAMLH